jgi:hypothetical protein
MSSGLVVSQAMAVEPGVVGQVAPAKVTAGKKFTASPVPRITGKAKVGQTLKVAAGKWAPAPVSLSYQWYRNGVKITKATSASYKVTKLDNGKQLSVKVTGKKAGYQSVTKTSAKLKVGAKAAVKPNKVNKIAQLTNRTTGKDPVKTAPKTGQVLTVKTGSWGKGVSLSYQWYRNGVKIKKATQKIHTVNKNDLGKKVSVKVTGKKAGRKAETKTSKASMKVVAAKKAAAKKLTATPVPTITGNAKVGQTLQVAVGKWTPAPVSLSYQWYRGGAKIANATKNSFTLTKSDQDKQISVKVTGKKAGYTSVTKASKATAKVAK